jgi:hypothetical protein
LRTRLPSFASAAASLVLVTSFLIWPHAQALADASWSDGFESGSLSAWTTSSGLTVQSVLVHDPGPGSSFAARSTGSVSWAAKTLPDVTSDIEVSMWFNFTSRQSPVWLTRLRTGSNGNLMKVMVNNGGKLVYRNDVAGVTRASTKVVSNGAWHRLQVRVTVAGTNGHVQISLDGVPVQGLDRVESMGTSPVGRVEIGNRPTGKVYDLAIDDVAVVDVEAQDTLLPPTGLMVDGVDVDGVHLTWSEPSGVAPTTYEIYRDNLLVGTVPAPASSFTDPTAGGVTRFVYNVLSTAGSSRSVPSTPAVATMPGFDITEDAVVYAAGDIACKPTEPTTATSCHHAATADIVASGAADAVLPLGDLQYEKGQLNNFLNSYGPTWGQVKPLSYPVPGNHEYDLDASASGYDTYFLSRNPVSAGTWAADDAYYSFALPSLQGWHFVALNSNCGQAEVGGCGAGSAQLAWLQADLQDPVAPCTLGYWHHPRYSSASTASRRSDPATQSLWAELASRDADVVLSGHVHLYERLAPIDASGTPDASGLRSFVVGTGGRNFDTAGAELQLGGIDVSERIIDASFGVLKLTLHQGSYEWAFVPEIGHAGTDSGSAACV